MNRVRALPGTASSHGRLQTGTLKWSTEGQPMLSRKPRRELVDDPQRDEETANGRLGKNSLDADSRNILKIATGENVWRGQVQEDCSSQSVPQFARSNVEP